VQGNKRFGKEVNKYIVGWALRHRSRKGERMDMADTVDTMEI
jgi:hypothetical protein